jgi:hypothetical protein
VFTTSGHLVLRAVSYGVTCRHGFILGVVFEMLDACIYRPSRWEAMCVLSDDMVTVPTTRTRVYPVDITCWGDPWCNLFCDLQQNENVYVLTINAQSCSIISTILTV